MYAVLFLVAIVGAVLGSDLQPVPYVRVCGGENVVVRAAGCGSTAPCPITRGQTLPVEIEFTAPGDVSGASVKSEVKANVFGLGMPWPGMNQDGCSNSGLQCPLVAGQKYTYKYDAEVKKAYPATQVSFKWTLTDAAGKQLFCFEMPVKLN